MNFEKNRQQFDMQRGDPDSQRIEFGELFQELTGIKATEARVGFDGWLLFPKAQT